MKQFLSFISLLFGTLALSGGVFAQPTPNAQDLIHLGDVIDVDVVGEFEYDWRGTLTPEGMINGVPGVTEPIPGLCRSESEVAADVAKNLSRLLRNPNIVVKILDRSNRPLARLEGAVRSPARFRMGRPVTLVELLVRAGGMTSEATGEISIFRPSGFGCRAATAAQTNQSEFINIKISEILTGKAEANPAIYSGDIIRVTRAAPIYVIGSVNSPRPLYPPGEMTVSRAVAAAGGITKGADAGRVTIFRRDGAERKLIEIDLEKIKRGESADEILKPFDIIDVSAKGGEPRKNLPVEFTGEENTGNGELPLRVID